MAFQESQNSSFGGYLSSSTQSMSPRARELQAGRYWTSRNQTRFDFTFGDFAEPICIEEAELRTRFDYASSNVNWVDAGVLPSKIKVEEWKDFERMAEDFQEAVNQTGQSNPSSLSRAESLFEAHKQRLEERFPDQEQDLRDHSFNLRDGIESILKNVKPSRESVRIETGFTVNTEGFETILGSRAMDRGAVMHRISLIPDFVLINESRKTDAIAHSFPVASIEVKGPRHAITLRDLHLAAFQANGFDDDPDEERKQFVKFFQHYLEHHDADWASVGQVHCQAMIEALFTYSGCAVLYFHTWARALRIKGIVRTRGGEEKVVVQVSRAHGCNERLGAALCATTLLDYALGTVNGPIRNQAEEALDKVFTFFRACLRIGGETSRIHRMSNDGRSKRRRTAGRQGEGNASRNGQLSNFDQHRLRQWKKTWTEVLIEHVELFRVPILSSLSADEKDEALKIILEADSVWGNEDLVRRAYDMALDVVGVGACGIVRRVLIDDIRAVLKYWSGEKEAQKPMLINEMALYCFLEAKNPDLGDQCIPKLIGVGMHYWVGEVLIITEVGKRIIRRNGTFFVGDEEVGRDEAEQIKVAAVNSLKLLHSAGCSNGDISLRNLRIEFVGGTPRVNAQRSSTNCWKARWIDLGFARLGGNEKLFQSEVELCEGLFRTYTTVRANRDAKIKSRKVDPKTGSFLTTAGPSIASRG